MITGSMLRDAVISAANHISNHKQEVDRLNVFPVPDGDTGTNMSMTIGTAAKELQRLPETVTVAEVSSALSSALLRGARGNSGVILSLLFRGFAKGMAGLKTARGTDFANALTLGVEAAYKAVMKPTEGTMLTVARVAGEQAKAFATDECSAISVWTTICGVCRETLKTTPELLPVLKKAGVVDAGGMGLCLIFEAMLGVFEGGEVIASADPSAISAPSTILQPDFAFSEDDGDITFGYCTEFIINRENDKDPLLLRAFLESFGDSVVVVDDDDIIKVHFHSNNPGKGIEEAITFGPITSVKIDNMRLQHQALVLGDQPEAQKNTYAPVDDSIEFGFVAVAAGEGVEQLFIDLGVDQVVLGGQTMNPSTDDILKAIEAVPAKAVFVLPNNKNIIMAAEQTIPLADRKVFVLPTRSIPQGLSAMLAFDPELSNEENQLGMIKAAERVTSGSITFAARDSSFDGHSIKKGDILALDGGKLLFTDRELEKAVVKLTTKLCKRDTSFITLLHGEDVSEQDAANIRDAIQRKLGDEVEIALINGGQPVYYFLISVE